MSGLGGGRCWIPYVGESKDYDFITVYHRGGEEEAQNCYVISKQLLASEFFHKCRLKSINLVWQVWYQYFCA